MPKVVYGSRASEPRATFQTTATRSFQVAEDIMPIAALKVRLSETVRGLDARGRPIVITLNGMPAAVVMSPRQYDELTYRARVVAAVDDGTAAADAGDVIDDDELGRRVAVRYGRPGRARRR
jgi:prevent-host-death family protein